MAHILASSHHCLPKVAAQKLAQRPASPAKASLRQGAQGEQHTHSGDPGTSGFNTSTATAQREPGREAMGDMHNFTKFNIPRRGVQKSKESDLCNFHMGGGEAGKELLEEPTALCGRTVKMLHPTDATPQVGKVLSWNAKKKEHKVSFNGETFDVNLERKHWLLCIEEPAGQQAVAKDPEGNVPQGDVPAAGQQGDISLAANGTSDKTEQESDSDGVKNGKGSRKRSARVALQDQLGVPQLSHQVGLIPSTGRRPYKSGGCKEGRSLRNEELVGRRVQVWSAKDSVYAAGGVSEYDGHQGLHKLVYLDDTHEWLNMETAIWRLGTPEHDSLYPDNFERDALGQGAIHDHNSPRDGQKERAAEGLMALARGDMTKDLDKDADDAMATEGVPGTTRMDPEVGKRLVASSMEFQVHKVTIPNSGYHVLCSVPPGTKIGDVHVTCGNACIIIEHGKNKKQEAWQLGNSLDRLVILLPEAIKPSSATAKLTQAGKLAVFTSLS